MNPTFKAVFSRLFFSVALTSLTCSARAVPAQIFVDAYHNKVYAWNGQRLTNSQDPAGVIEVSQNPLKTSVAPILWSPNQMIMSTQDGRILTYDLQKQKLDLLYSSEGECLPEFQFKGCIYSMILSALQQVYFLEHQPDGTDNIVVLTPDSHRTLVTQVPGPSGPLWLKPDGRLAVLPYNQGVIEFSIPAKPSSLAQISQEAWPLQTPASSAAEGITGALKSVLVYHDFSMIHILENRKEVKAFSAQPVTFDPCSGSIWYFDNSETLQNFSYVYATALPVNPKACPWITEWKKITSSGSAMPDDRWDVIQGFPSGQKTIPALKVFSLGINGSIELETERLIHASGEADLRIFENTMQTKQGLFAEPARVEIFDGSQWKSTGCNCQNPQPEFCAGMQPTNSSPGNGVAPWSDEAGGFPVNLSLLGLKQALRVRLTDCGQSPKTPFAPGIFAGFDLDAIIANPKSLEN